MYQINLKVKNPKSKIFLNPANYLTLHFLSCLLHCVYYKKTRECQEIQRRQGEDQETSKVEEPIIGEDRVDSKILEFSCITFNLGITRFRGIRPNSNC